MFDPEIIEKLRREFPDIPLLIFHRSCEYAESVGDLFDILSGFPHKYPTAWMEDEHRWITVDDIKPNQSPWFNKDGN
jgi:hypothetical protein